MRDRFCACAAVLAAALLFAAPADAHKASDAYLSLSVAGDREVRGQWDIALRDLELAIGLDGDSDGHLTWGEVRARHGAIAAHALAHLRVRSGETPCAGRVLGQQVDQHTDGAYAVLRLSFRCANDGPLSAEYDLLFAIDPQHRGLLRVEHGGATTTSILSPERPRVELASQPNAWDVLRDFGREGVWHIWIGLDHVLFLLCLLLPAVARRVDARPLGKGGMGNSVGETVRVVTAFTASHSLSLGLAVFGYVNLPSRLVESAIAASIVVTALDNLRPFLRAPRAVVAFAFGLVHGLGFASVLGDLGLPNDARAVALLGFNLGVEAGQLAIVAGFLPISLALRRTAFSARVAVAGGSWAIGLIATAWLWERAVAA